MYIDYNLYFYLWIPFNYKEVYIYVPCSSYHTDVVSIIFYVLTVVGC